MVKYKKEDGMVKPIEINCILISTQHDGGISNDEIKKTITDLIIKKVCPAEMLTSETRILINPSGSF